MDVAFFMYIGAILINEIKITQKEKNPKLEKPLENISIHSSFHLFTQQIIKCLPMHPGILRMNFRDFH